MIVKLESNGYVVSTVRSVEPLSIREILDVASVDRFVPWVDITYEQTGSTKYSVSFVNYGTYEITEACTIALSPPILGG